MLIVCPSCASRYSIDDEKIGLNGKTVRCASCRTDFFASPASVLSSVLAPVQILRGPLSGSDLHESDEAMAKDWLDAENPDNVSTLTSTSQPGQIRDVPRDLDQGEMDALFAQEMAAAQLDAQELAQPLDATKPTPGWRRFLPAWPQKRPSDASAQLIPASANDSLAGPPSGSGQSEFGQSGSKQAASRQAGAQSGASGRAKALAGNRHQQGLSATGLAARISRLLKGPAGLALAGVLTMVAVLHQRDNVVRALPSSASLFAAIGLPINLQGLVFSDVRSMVVSEGNARFLVVDGVVKSVRTQTVPVPLIEISIRGDDRRTVYAWTMEPPRSSLKPGEALQFRARLATPPEAGRDVEVSFADRPEKTLAQR